jgi:hypothetical protein
MSQKEGQGIKEFGFLDPKSFGYGGSVVEKPPSKVEQCEIRPHGGVVEDSVYWNVTLCINVFPNVPKGT